MTNPGLNLYLLFIISWFLRLPARLPILGIIRFDLLLLLILSVLVVSRRLYNGIPAENADKLLRILIAYCFLSIPFVEWPGSVIKFGLPNLIKAVAFFYLTIAFVRTEYDLKRFVFVFLTCQVLRVLEPLYLNVTQGYWGSTASMSGGSEFMLRLSGSPYDVVNPNGLAAIVCAVLPFLYFMQGLSWRHRTAFILLTPPLLYALALTGSRTGQIGLLIIFFVILIKSKRRVLLLGSVIVAAVLGFSNMSPDLQDRYLSTFGKGEKNAATAHDRVSAMEGQWRVALRRPLFGHGLGTSKDANFHFNDLGPYAGKAILSHNLFLEVAQELGLIGVIIFGLFMKSIFLGFMQSQFRRSGPAQERGYLPSFISAMQTWVAVSLVFTLASYGLSSDGWYLLGGLLVVVQRLKAFNVQPPTTNTGIPGNRQSLTDLGASRVGHKYIATKGVE